MDLKEYIKFIKKIESKKTIILTVPDDKISNISEIAGKIKKAYPDKNLYIKTDPGLIAGMKIQNDDLVYEVSMKEILEEAVGKI